MTELRRPPGLGGVGAGIGLAALAVAVIVAPRAVFAGETGDERATGPSTTVADESHAAFDHGGGRSAHRVETSLETSSSAEWATSRFGVETSLDLFRSGPLTLNTQLDASVRATARDETGTLPQHVFGMSETLELRSPTLWALASLYTVSDQLFDDPADLMYGFLAVYDILQAEAHGLFIGGFYSSLFLIPGLPKIPLPLIVYQYRSPSFSAMGPIPFALKWDITSSLTCAYTFQLDSQEMYLRLTPVDAITVGLEATYEQKAIALVGRSDEQKMRWLEGGRVGVRLQATPVSVVRIIAFGGATVLGRAYDAESTFTEKTNDRTLANGLFVDLSVRVTW
jgi:hypothetical protein